MNARLLCAVVLASSLGSLGCRTQPAARVDVQTRDPGSKPDQQGAGPTSGNRPGAGGQLARVRPRPVPCSPTRGMPPHQLLERAAAFQASGELGRALSCADEALRTAPRSVAALRQRARTLVALERHGEARLAYARALAVDPDDAETLHGAADLYVGRNTGDRDGLLIGLEHALRGARIASASKDRDLAARLLLVAAMAENDLGRSREALGHLDQALRDRPRDPAVHYERGVALFELVRFAEARASLEKALSLAPEDAWTLHYLARVAEHQGDLAGAEALEARARQLAPAEFRWVEIGEHEFDLEVRRAIAALPEVERRALQAVPLELADSPSLDDLTAVDPPLSPTILGLFRGPAASEPCDDDGEACRSIVLYRRNLARFARDRRELAEQVRVTLLHELGHLNGESDDDLRDRGLE